MNGRRLLVASECWVKLLLAIYPRRFREEVGAQVVEAYRDRCRAALRDGGPPALAVVWLRAGIDSVRNGPGERVRPSATGQPPDRGGLRSVELRRGNRKVLAYSLGIAALAHLAVFFIWSPEFEVEFAEATVIRRSEARQGANAAAFVEVLFGPPEIVTGDGTIAKEPPDRTLRAGRVVQLPIMCAGLAQWGSTPSTGTVRLRVNAAGRVDKAQLTRGTGDSCADQVIITVAGSLWYHWLPNDRFPAPLDLSQPITLAAARDWSTPRRLRF